MNLLEPFFYILLIILDLYFWVLIVWVVMSWLIAFEVINTRNRFVYQLNYFLFRVTEPALKPIRRFMPNLGGIDISPVVLMLAIFFLQRMIAQLALTMGVYPGY